MKTLKNPSASRPVKRTRSAELLAFIEFTLALTRGKHPDLQECRQFSQMPKASAAKTARIINYCGGDGIKLVRLAWLAVVQSLIAEDKRSIPKFRSVVDCLENPDLIKPPPIYTTFPTPTHAAETVRAGVVDSLDCWHEEELLECSVGYEKWFALMARKELAARKLARKELKAQKKAHKELEAQKSLLVGHWRF